MMDPADFQLQHSNVPQPELFDFDPERDEAWPLPAPKAWAPEPRRNWWQRARDLLASWREPFELGL